MVRGISEQHIGEIVDEKRLEELKAMTDDLDYYETIALGKFLQKRRNKLAFDVAEKLEVGKTAKVFDISKGREIVGNIIEINGTVVKLDVDGSIYRVPAEMLYE